MKIFMKTMLSSTDVGQNKNSANVIIWIISDTSEITHWCSEKNFYISKLLFHTNPKKGVFEFRGEFSGENVHFQPRRSTFPSFVISVTYLTKFYDSKTLYILVTQLSTKKLLRNFFSNFLILYLYSNHYSVDKYLQISRYYRDLSSSMPRFEINRQFTIPDTAVGNKWGTQNN